MDVYGRLNAGISVEGTRAHAGEIVVGRDGGKTRPAVVAKAPEYAGSGLIPGQAFLPTEPLELFISDPDGGSEGATRELLTFVTMAVPHIGDVTKDLVLHALAKTTS
jgi:hypothetical protein